MHPPALSDNLYSRFEVIDPRKQVKIHEKCTKMAERHPLCSSVLPGATQVSASTQGAFISAQYGIFVYSATLL